MKNPNGPYPGRQVFVGATVVGNPAFAYLVTGRSPQSRERKATLRENSIIMGPIGNTFYDCLRHYIAVKYDNAIGLVALSNGIQTEAIFETYKLFYYTDSAPDGSYLKNIMAGANFEPDSLKTPRISAVIMNLTDKTTPVYYLSIIADGSPAAVWSVSPGPKQYYGVATYCGDIENPVAYDIGQGPAGVTCDARTPKELAEFLYDISAANHQGDDIRVCAIGGIRMDNAWKVALINRHKE